MTKGDLAAAGRALKARREALGWMLDEVERRTNVPRAHLVALEEGRVADLPPGPYAAAYVRAYQEALGAESTVPAPQREEPVAARTSPFPLWGVRIVAVLAIGTLVSVVAWQVWRAGIPAGLEALAPDGVDSGDGQTAHSGAHVLRVVGRRTGKVTVLADGKQTYDGPIAEGQTLNAEAVERLEVVLSAVEVARVEVDGEALVPLGRQDEPRRLVFVDDLGR